MLGVKNRPTPSQLSADVAQFGKRKVCNPKVAQWFKPTVRHYFSSNNVRLSACTCTSLQVKTHSQNDWSVTNQIEYTGLRQDFYI